MIGAGVQIMHDLRIHAGIKCGAGDDLLEQVCADAAGAGVGGEQAARPEQLETEQVDVLVTARGFFGESGGGCELGRVEDDEVELASLVAQRAQGLKYVGIQPFSVCVIKSVAGDIFCGDAQRVSRSIMDSTDFAPPRSAYSEKPPV